MRVAVDATAVVSGDTGVARYARMLVAELEHVGDVEPLPFAIGRGRPAPYGVVHTKVPLRVIHAAWRTVRRPSLERLVGDVDVVHSLDMIPPPTRAPVVLTVHDVLPLRLPHLYSPRSRAIARSQAEAARRAAVVVADCATTADEIADLLGRDRSSIFVAPPGPRSLPTQRSALRPPSSEPYVLAVGALTPRKGFVELAAALAALGAGAPLLVIAGPDGWRAGEVRAAVRQRLGDRVALLGRVDDDRLVSLYTHAIAVVHPSSAEGFGIPVLEALALGAPVVAAEIPSVREIAGGAAVLVPPNDVGALTEALGRVVADEALRSRLTHAGRERASAYTWEATAVAVAEAYRVAART